MDKCLICGSSFLELLCDLRNIPKAAQYFVPLADTSEPINDSINLSIYQCKTCYHVQQISAIVPYHLDVITASSLSPTTLKARDKNISDIISRFSLVDPYIIEIGSFKGEYIAHLINIGYTNSYGLENNVNSINQSCCDPDHLYQGHVHNLSSSFLVENANRYDIALCFNFLEHSIDPHSFMRGVCSLLRPGGIAYFTLPSVDYIFEESLVQEFVPDHISYFTSHSLEILFRIFNFTELHVSKINNNNDLMIIAQLSPNHSGTSLAIDLFSSLVNDINKIMHSIDSDKTIAFWGAGHRSLTLISQIHYQCVLSVVDSASFKQGHFTPVSRIPIISPSDYQDNPTDILFLSLPGIYNDEVWHSIQSWTSPPSTIYSIVGNKLIKLT